jgi:hypothetical protein
MDEFGPIAVDIFHERTVAEVRQGSGEDGDPVWSIVFEGGGAIHNFDPTLPRPDSLVGAVYTHTMLGSSDGTLLYFDRSAMRQLVLNPMQYAIEEQTLTKGAWVFAQRSRFQMASDA